MCVEEVSFPYPQPNTPLGNICGIMKTNIFDKGRVIHTYIDNVCDALIAL